MLAAALVTTFSKYPYTNYYYFIFSGSAAQRGLWPPRHPRFLDHIWRAILGRTPLGRVISSSQRPLLDYTQHTQQINIHALGGILTHDRSRRTAVDLRLIPRGYWDQHPYTNTVANLCFKSTVLMMNSEPTLQEWRRSSKRRFLAYH
jgi:hypothetical protein